jgi:hypothetical protein
MVEQTVIGAQRPSRQDILHLMGEVDDAVVTAILTTGASYVEIEEAVNWVRIWRAPVANSARSSLSR